MPYGFIRLQGRNYNAMCESGVIEAKQNVVVIAVQQRNLIVAPTHLSPTESVPIKTPEPSAPPESLLDRPAEELGLDSLE